MTSPRRPPLLPIEPLPEKRWAAFEDQLFEALDRDGGDVRVRPSRPVARVPSPPRRLAWIGALAAAVVLAGVGGWQARGHLAGASRASSPTRMVSGASPSHLALGDSDLDLGAETAVVATGDDDRGVVLVVERGSVWCTVAPRASRPPFFVQAGDVRVRVVGTRFSVTRVGEGARVEVDHGVVEVSAGSDRLTLHDGQSWSSAAASPTGEAATVPSSPAGVPSSPIEVPGGAVASDSASLQAGVPPTRPLSARDRFEAAARLERTEPTRAVAQYAELAAGGGSWAANALFAEARLEADRGHGVQARRLAAQYLSRFPSGPNAADARVLLGGN
jgi:hypothetical protein